MAKKPSKGSPKSKGKSTKGRPLDAEQLRQVSGGATTDPSRVHMKDSLHVIKR